MTPVQLALGNVELVKNDALEAGQSVAHVGQTIMKGRGSLSVDHREPGCHARGVRALVLALCLVSACASQDAPAASARPAEPAASAPEVAKVEAVPGALLPAPTGSVVVQGTASAPPRGCALVAERTLSDDASRIFVASDRSARVVLVVSADGRSLTRLRGVDLATLAPLARDTLEAPLARGTLASDRLGMRLVWVDGRGRVLFAPLTERAALAPRVLAEGADRRFAPAYAVLDGQDAVAFTRTVDTAMHTFLARLDGARLATVDLTPPAHGAASPTFVLGETKPRLVAIDARAGVSPLLELPLDEGEQVVVRTPVSQPYTPPLIAAVRIPDAGVQVAFTAVGKLAATAVGRVPLEHASEALALLPSRGYGEVTFAVALGPHGALFALESPRSEKPAAPRSLELKRLDAEGEGPTLTLASEGPSAEKPSLAILDASTVWLGYVREKSAVIAALSCAL